jgi:uncharacterized protein YfaS (alpha-2-macroglobulin family)
MSRLAYLALLVALPALAQDFDSANRTLQEKSYTRACDAFTAYLKATPSGALAREATVKKAVACAQAGRGGWDELRKLADSGEKDFPRAVALHFLWTRGERGFDLMAPLLKQALGGEGRQATEARALLEAAILREMDNNSWNVARVDQLAELGLSLNSKAEVVANYRLRRGRTRLNQSQKVKEAEAELLELGRGSSGVADEALYAVAERREQRAEFEAALSLYDEIVNRFSSMASSVRASAQERAKEIRRPWVSLSVPTNELPGVKPSVSLSFRNVKNAQWALRKVDPLAQGPGVMPRLDTEPTALQGPQVKAWSTTLQAPSRHAQGSTQFELPTAEPGLYVLDLTADGQKATTWALVSQHALITKSDRQQVTVALFDVETGAAQPNADVALFTRTSTYGLQRHDGKTDADGIATFKLERTSETMFAWSRSGPQLAYSTAGNAYWSRYSREELAYVATDRPLYKPGETVGLKLYLRSREGGPSTPLSGVTVTVRVADPNGKEALRQDVTTSAFGTASLSLPLPKNCTLGAWSISVQGGNRYYRQASASFRVEEYKPPEYVVSVEPLGAAKPGDVVRFRVRAKYYSGGAVANAQGRALVTVHTWQHRFGPWPGEEPAAPVYGGYDEYGDDDYSPRRRSGYRGYQPWYQLAQHTLQFKTGADGTAEVEVPALAQQVVQPSLEYRVQVFVTDASRREIQGAGSIKVSARDFFVDVRTGHFLYRPGERVDVKLRAEDANGRPADGDVALRLLRLADDGTTSRITETRTRLLKGEGRAVLDADAVGRVRLEVLDGASETDTVLTSTDLWLTSDSKPIVPGPGFQLYVDRAPLKVGDSLRVLVAGATPGGHALVTLESDVLVATRMVSLVGRARFVEIPVTAEVAPNGWLHAARYEQTQLQMRQLPVRVKGSEVEVPVSVDFGRGSAEPGTAVTATVKAALPPGAQAETALTIVDEALFAIAPERTDFLAFFGRTNRNQGVRTDTSFNVRSTRARPVKTATPTRPDSRSPSEPQAESAVADALPLAQKGGPTPAPPPASAPAGRAQRAEMAEMASAPAKESSKAKRALADDSGPGEGPADEPVKARTDFGSSAGWYPALSTKGGALSQKVTLTDSLTSWKATATVVTDGPTLGVGSGRIRTAKPLMVRLQAPRFFIEGDEVVLSAVVESHLPKAADVEVVLSAPGFTALTPSKKTVRVEPEQVLRVDAKFKVVELGERTLRAQVKGGGTADAMEWKLPAFVHGSAQRQFFAGRVKDVQGFEFELPEKRKASLTRLELTMSPTLLAVMFDALPYLAEYPYGCVEQTLSRFVPATIARRAVKDLNLPADRVPAQLDDMTQKGLERLYGFQHGDGGWGWWQSDPTNLWMTAYVVSSLSLAKASGLDVRADVIKRGRDFLVNNLGTGRNSPETHAYMVYALASTGGAPKAAVDTVFERRTSLTPRARAQLALALLHLGDARARIAVENLDDIVKAASSRPDAAVGDATDAWSTSAAIEATAFTLMAYARYDLKSPLIGPLTDFLVLRRNGGRWRNTRDTAFAVYALSELASREGAAAKSGLFVVSVNGREVKRVPYKNGGLDLKEPLVLGDGAFKAGKNVVQVRHDGSGTGYYGALVDVFNMNDFIRGVGGDVKVKRTYTLLGKPSTERGPTPDAEYGMPVESGVRVRVDLELTANKAVEFVMLEDLKPAGFEAVQLQSGPQVCNYQCAHAELRTDRVAMFLQQLPVGTTKLSYELRAEVPGRFSALPARLEAMYAPELQATADEMRFEVRDAPEAGQVAR